MASTKFVKKTYFLSPTYAKKFTDKEHFDELDHFNSWIQQNTFSTQHAQYKPCSQSQEWLGYTGFLMGENAVLCKLRDNTISVDKDGRAVFFATHSFDPVTKICSLYRRVIEVESTPASKELPRELTDLLDTHSYRETTDGQVLHYSKFD